MHELQTEYPDPSIIVELAPEVLGAKILFILRRRLEFHRAVFFSFPDESVKVVPQGNFGQGGWSNMAGPLRNEVVLAFSEAWAWLTAQGLLVPAPGHFSPQGVAQTLSRRAKAFESEAKVVSFANSRLLPKEILHPKIADYVWSAFMRQDFDAAIHFAHRQVEIAVKEATSISKVGVALMRDAFNPEKGMLLEPDGEGSNERQACMDLFAGSIGVYKNPQSHSLVAMDDPVEAMEIIMIANQLLRIVDRRVAVQVRKSHVGGSV